MKYIPEKMAMPTKRSQTGRGMFLKLNSTRMETAHMMKFTHQLLKNVTNHSGIIFLLL